MTNPKFKKIAVVANLKKDEVKPILKDIVAELLAEGFAVYVEPRMQPYLKSVSGLQIGISRECDVILSLGGDGTMLHVARQFADLEIPILGLKVGRLGFLTETIGADTIKKIKKGKYRIQDRMRITARIKERNKVVASFNALNDVVVHGAGFSRMIQIRTAVDDTFMREYRADGVIVSTPTGSTAYSLSAGGPLMAPIMEAMLVTPLNPHSMSVRPIVLDSSERLEIHVSGASKITLTVDGQEGSYLSQGQHIVVRKSSKVTRLVVPEGYDFFNLLREKL